MSSSAAYARWKSSEKEVESLPGEEWREAPRCPGYWVSNFGRAKSKHTLLSLYALKSGHINICPSVGGKQRPRALHVLICEAWHGPRPYGMEVAHLNGNPGDNRPENLKWATRLENQRHRFEHGTDARGHRNGRSKLTEAQVAEIMARTDHPTAIAADFGIGVSHVRNIKAGARWGPLRKPVKNNSGARMSPEVAAAIELIRGGMKPRDAAIQAGAHLTSVRCRVTIERKAGRLP